MNEKTGLPIPLTIFLRDLLGVKVFIETGTGLGRTAKIASGLFENVYTIEASKERWLYNKAQFDNTNVYCVLGESPNALEETIKSLGNETAIIFLDAHCSYRQQITDVACPVLEEIRVIPSKHIVIIDDAHSFTAPHKVKSVMDEWPELIDVLFALAKRDLPYVFIEGKSIVGVPRAIKTQVQEFVYEWRK